MKYAIPRGRLRPGLLAAVLTLACACTGDATSPGGLPDGLAPGIYPVVGVVETGGAAARVDLYLKGVDVPPALAGYQGEITWDAALLTLDAVQLPAGMVGSTHQAAPGRVRFAAAGGVGDGPLLTLVFTRRGRITREAFSVAIEEATSDAFDDVTALVVSGTPYLLAR